MRHSARAIIIRDRKLLLVTAHGTGSYWTPGAGIEHGEESLQTLRRELHEELGVSTFTHQEFSSYAIDDQTVTNFLVTTADTIVPASEITDYIWYGSSDLRDNTIQVSEGVRKMIIPQLINDGLF